MDKKMGSISEEVGTQPCFHGNDALSSPLADPGVLMPDMDIKNPPFYACPFALKLDFQIGPDHNRPATEILVDTLKVVAASFSAGPL